MIPLHVDPVYRSRRSNVLARRGIVAASQPLAAQAGLGILQAGGTAADAAVATAAMLNVVEPVSTGVGGDCFALYWDGQTKQVSALNGSGRAPRAASIEELLRLGYTRMPSFTPSAFPEQWRPGTTCWPATAAWGWPMSCSRPSGQRRTATR